MSVNQSQFGRLQCDVRAALSYLSRAYRAAFALIALTLHIFSLATQATAQTNPTNQSSLGTNLGGVSYYTSEQPFLNILKTGGGWAGNTTDGTRFNEIQGAFNLDANGYPTTMTGAGPAAGRTFTEIDTLVFRGLGVSSAAGSQGAPFYPAGNYVFLYSGTGAFDFEFDCTNSNIVSSAAGRIVIDIPTPSAGGCRIATTNMGSGSNYPHNMAFVYSPDSTGPNIGTNEALYNNGGVFNPTFISRISHFGTLRFMDWMQTNSTVQTNWSGRPTPTQAFWGIQSSPGNVDPMPQGVPVEVMVALANQIDADAWFNMPPLSTDDYVTQFATLVHNGDTDSGGRVWSGLNSNLMVYVEYGNEIWNNGALATFNTNANGTQGGLVSLGWNAFPSAQNDWNAGFIFGILRAVQNGATWKSVWGKDASRVVRVLAGQISYQARNEFLLSFTAGMYGGNSSSFSGTAAANVDAFAVAPYFGSGYPIPDTFTPDQLFQEMMSGGLVSGGYPGGMIAQVLSWVAQNYADAQNPQYGNGLPLVAYEGGQSLIDSSGSDTVLENLYSTANLDPRMGTAYAALLNGWESAGGTLFNSFNDIGTYSKWGYWGALQNVLQTSSPKYDALMSFIANGKPSSPQSAPQGQSAQSAPQGQFPQWAPQGQRGWYMGSQFLSGEAASSGPRRESFGPKN